MMFVDVNPELSQAEANNILSIWQTSLQNSHIVAERYHFFNTCLLKNFNILFLSLYGS